MPRRNTRNRRHLIDHHVFNRQRDRQAMFLDDDDRRTFLWMIARHLSSVPHFDRRGRPYADRRGDVKLLAFALMVNHFHLVLRQLRSGGLESFMRPLMSQYVRYFNRRHGSTGEMFRGRYRAVPRIDARSRRSAIAYVHDNHGRDCDCAFCSARYYADPEPATPSWIDRDAGLEIFGGREAYLTYRDARAYLL